MYGLAERLRNMKCEYPESIGVNITKDMTAIHKRMDFPSMEDELVCYLFIRPFGKLFEKAENGKAAGLVGVRDSALNRREDQRRKCLSSACRQ